MAKILNQIASALEGAKSIAIMPHVSADGDAIGSSLALAIALSNGQRKVKVFLEEDVPFIYSFLPGKELAEVYRKSADHYDTVVALDCGDTGRLGRRLEIFNDGRITINIDHHNTNSEFAFHNFVDIGASAVGEIIYQLIQMMGLDISKEMAACLYVAIATDTGGFRFSNTTALTHQITSDLVNRGIDVADISQRIFNSTTLGKIKLTGVAIESLEIMDNGKIAIISITNEEMEKSGAIDEDSDGLVNIARNINGVEVAAMIRQRDDGEIKVNLRAAGVVDVSAIASLYKGGGHKKAAGYTIQSTLEEAKEKLLKDIREVL